MSAAEAIKAIHVVDTVIWTQTRHIPLELDKRYKRAMATLSKLKNVESDAERSLTSILHLPQDTVTDPEEVDNDDNEYGNETDNSFMDSTTPPEIVKLQSIHCQAKTG